MSKPAWTPGPWGPPVPVDGLLDEQFWSILCNDGHGEICVIPRRNSEDEANARLTAAAPDLYEALNEAINHVALHAARTGDEKASAFLDKCTAALAKARGEQP